MLKLGRYPPKKSSQVTLKQHDFMLFVFNFWLHEIWVVSKTNIRENWKLHENVL